MKENGRSVFRDGKWFASSKGAKSRASNAKRTAIIGVGRSEVVASIDSLLDEAAAVLASPDSVLVVELGRCTTHVEEKAGTEKGAKMIDSVIPSVECRSGWRVLRWWRPI